MQREQPSLVCGAKTRCGEPCPNKPVKGKRRCRMHGGAPGSGGQPGNMNALKNGRWGDVAASEIGVVRTLVSVCSKILEF